MYFKKFLSTSPELKDIANFLYIPIPPDQQSRRKCIHRCWVVGQMLRLNHITVSRLARIQMCQCPGHSLPHRRHLIVASLVYSRPRIQMHRIAWHTPRRMMMVSSLRVFFQLEFNPTNIPLILFCSTWQSGIIALRWFIVVWLNGGTSGEWGETFETWAARCQRASNEFVKPIVNKCKYKFIFYCCIERWRRRHNIKLQFFDCDWFWSI